MLMKKSGLTKISYVLTLLLLCSVLFAGCSSTQQAASSATGSAQSSSPASTGSVSSPSPAETEETIKFAFTVPMDDAGGVGGAKFQEVLESESGGKFKVNMFPAGQQGSMKEHWEGCQLGGLNVVYAPGSALETFVSEVSILDLPFLFPSDYDTAWKVIDGQLSEGLNKLMNDKGLQLLGIAPYGYNQIHTSKKIINTVDDLKGLKMRIIPSPLKIFEFEQWGTNPTPIEFAELYTALQQGVVDGGENALLVIKTQKLYEVQQYLTISDHALFTGLLGANKSWYDSLSDQKKAWLKDASLANIETQRKFVADERVKTIEFFKQNGVTVTNLTEDARKGFVEKSIPTQQEYASKSDAAKNLLDSVYADLEKNGIKIES